MSATTYRRASAAHPDGGASLKAILARWMRRTRAARQRRAVHDMPDYLLRDIGLTRGELDRAFD